MPGATVNPQAGVARNPPGCPDLESVRSLFLIAQVMHEVSLFVKCSNPVFAGEATSLFPAGCSLEVPSDVHGVHSCDVCSAYAPPNMFTCRNVELLLC